jgi:hypothetical protein
MATAVTVLRVVVVDMRRLCWKETFGGQGERWRENALVTCKNQHLREEKHAVMCFIQRAA